MIKRTEHPDANLLAAFAEHVLRGKARMNVLTHLADCARCREIVFLAHEARSEEAAPSGKLATAPKTAFRFNWRFAAVAVALFLAVSPVIWEVYEHTGKSSTTHEAVNNPPVNHEAQIMLPMEKTAPAPKVASEKTAPPTTHAQVLPESATGTAETAPPEILSGGVPVAIAPVLAAPSNPGTTRYEASPAMQQRMEQRRTLEQERVEGAVASANARTQSARASLVNEKTAASASAETRAMKAESFDVGQAPGSALSYESHAESSPPVMAVERPLRAVPLPNRKTIASRITIRGRILMLGQDGSLTVSIDGGSSWREVTKQWQGKATQLMPLPSQQKNGESVLLWNDANRAWISTDGGDTWSSYTAPQSTNGSGSSR